METTSSFMTYQNHEINDKSYSLHVELPNPKSVTRAYLGIFCRLSVFSIPQKKKNFLNINSVLIPTQDAVFS